VDKRLGLIYAQTSPAQLFEFYPPEGLAYVINDKSNTHLIGDSILDGVFDSNVAILNAGGRTCTSQAVSGHTIVNQYTAWLADPRRGDTTVDVIVIACGVNNARNNQVTTATVDEMNTLIRDIRTMNPTTMIILCVMTPARAHLELIGASRYEKYLAFQAELYAAGSASSTIDRVDAIVSSHDVEMDDGTDNLKGIYDSGDDLHPNDAGEAVMATAIRTAIDGAVEQFTVAATYSVWAGYRGDDEAVEFSGTASADSYYQNLSSASGYSQANRRKVNLASTTNLVVGRQYELKNALGQKEIVKVVAISTSSYAEVEYDLAYDYTTTATFRGIRHTFIPPNVFVNDESKINAEEYPYRIRWSYHLGALPGRYLQFFDLLRHLEQVGLVDDDLKDAWPDVAYLIETESRKRIMVEAEATLDKDLRLRGVDPAEIAPQAMVTQILKDCFTMLAIRSGKAVPQGFDAPTALRTFTRAYLDGLELAVTGGKLAKTNNRGDDNSDTQPQQKLLCCS
jgi:lysophospholipase L1-like esterase